MNKKNKEYNKKEWRKGRMYRFVGGISPFFGNGRVLGFKKGKVYKMVGSPSWYSGSACLPDAQFLTEKGAFFFDLFAFEPVRKS